MCGILLTPLLECIGGEDGNPVVAVATARAGSATGYRLRALPGSFEWVVVYQKLDTTVAKFSPDGKLILTAASDGLARLRKADRSGDPVIFGGHQQKINAAAFTADGARIVTVSDDGTAMIWNVVKPGRYTSGDARSDLLVLRGHDAPVNDSQYPVEVLSNLAIRFWVRTLQPNG